jgi:peptidoglycan/xylan/chitin deacetylase (PgdA/CDA1 family)
VLSQTDVGAVSPEAALELMRQGEWDGALKLVAQLRQISSGSLYTETISGALLLDSGDMAGALSSFKEALSRAPAEGLLSYGLAIAEIGSGDLPGAEHDLRISEQNDGDTAAIQGARHYIRFLRGDYSPEKVGNPSFADPALDAMVAVHLGKLRDVTNLMPKAVVAGGGDVFMQCEGPLMSFESGRPIVAAYEPANSNKSSDSGEHDSTGDLLLAPDDLPHGAAYAAYSLDGEPLSIVGTRPFTYTLNTRRATNGRHKVTIVLYNAAGDEISRIDRTIRVFNSQADTRRSVSDRDTRIRAMLWRALELKPDRCLCAYAAGSAFRSIGDQSSARIWFSRAAAIRAGFRDTRAQLQACGGLNQPGLTVFSGRSDEKCVALTFDDGPKPGVTEPLLDVLVAAHVPATFFVIGRHIEEYPELARAIASAGMEIENHSYTHRSLTAISGRDAIQEMLATQAAVLAITGKLPRYIRPPGGNWNNKVAEIARQWGLTPCMWSVDVFDAEIIGAQKVAETVLSQVKPGSIILMHNGKVSTLQALPNILHVLRSRGYRFVTVDELARRSIGDSAAHRNGRAEPRSGHTE